eukprot:4189763-Alexandrium_andersonii.AAC.1
MCSGCGPRREDQSLAAAVDCPQAGSAWAHLDCKQGRWAQRSAHAPVLPTRVARPQRPAALHPRPTLAPGEGRPGGLTSPDARVFLSTSCP